MNDISNLDQLVKPKSDQLNADDLVGGPITVNILEVQVKRGDQPVSILIDGGHMPFKPCKSMVRVLIQAWGKDGKQWAGKAMTLYRDESVKWAGKAIGGIRISHLSHLAKETKFMVTVSRSLRSEITVFPLLQEDFSIVVDQYTAASQEEKEVLWPSYTQAQQGAITQAFNQ